MLTSRNIIWLSNLSWQILNAAICTLIFEVKRQLGHHPCYLHRLMKSREIYLSPEVIALMFKLMGTRRRPNHPNRV